MASSSLSAPDFWNIMLLINTKKKVGIVNNSLNNSLTQIIFPLLCWRFLRKFLRPPEAFVFAHAVSQRTEM